MIYTDATQVQEGRFPAILALGDSWFWYPVNNILNEISRVVRADYANVYSIGKVGARLSEYVNGGTYARSFANQLEPDAAKYYSAVCLSGAGNDAVQWRFALKPNCSAESSVESCIDGQAFDALIAQLTAEYATIILQVKGAYDVLGLARPHIFLHTYDYPPCNGFGFGGARTGPLGPWITNAMNACEVVKDRPFREQLAALFIRKLQASLAQFSDPGGKVHVVCSAGTLDPAYEWANELHPTAGGFTKIVYTAWLPHLDVAGLT